MIHILHHQEDRLLDVLTNKGERRYWNDIHEKDVQGLNTYQFTTLSTVPSGQHLEKRARFIIPAEEGGYYEEFIVMEAVTRQKEKQVFAKASYHDINKQRVIEPRKYESWTLAQYVEQALLNTEWKVGTVEYAGIRSKTFDRYLGAYDFLNQIQTLFNHEFEMRFRVEVLGNKITGRYIDLLNSVGADTKKEIVYGKDLAGVEKRVYNERIITQLIALGTQQDGNIMQVTVNNEEAFQRWNRNGYHITDIYEPETESVDMTEERLTQLAELELKKRIDSVVEYTIEAITLEKLYPHEKVRLGDRIRVKDPEFSPPLIAEARVIQVRRSITDESQKTYIIGEIVAYETVPEPQKIVIKKEVEKSEPVVFDGDFTLQNPVYIWVDPRRYDVLGFILDFRTYRTTMHWVWWRYDIKSPVGDMNRTLVSDNFEKPPIIEGPYGDTYGPQNLPSPFPDTYIHDIWLHGIKIYFTGSWVTIWVIFEYTGDAANPYEWEDGIGRSGYGQEDDFRNGDNTVNDNGWRLSSPINITLEQFETFRQNYLQGQVSRHWVEWISTYPEKVDIYAETQAIVENEVFEIETRISEQITDTEKKINSATDTKISSAAAELNNQIAETETKINSATDTKIADAETNINSATDTKIADAETNINSATDTKIADAETNINSATDTKIADAETNINSATDTKIADAKTELTNQIATSETQINERITALETRLENYIAQTGEIQPTEPQPVEPQPDGTQTEYTELSEQLAALETRLNEHLSQMGEPQPDGTQTEYTELSEQLAALETRLNDHLSQMGETQPENNIPQESFAVKETTFKNNATWIIPNELERMPILTVYKFKNVEVYGNQPFGSSYYGGNLSNLTTASAPVTLTSENNLEIQWDEPTYGKVVYL